MQTATAAVLTEPGGPFQLESVQLEQPRENEVLVRVVATGICHTDVKVASGYRKETPFPVVLGHEGAGIVSAVGAGVTQVRPGDRVVLTFNSCGHCNGCTDGHPAYCDAMDLYCFACQRPDGSSPIRRNNGNVAGNFFGQSSFATFAMANERNVVLVPEQLPLDLMGPLGCGVQTGAGAVLNTLKVGVGDSIAVFGTGSVGLSAVMAAHLAGAQTIVAVDINPTRLELAHNLGATHTFEASEGNAVVESIRRATQGGVLFSLDTTNNPSVVRQAFDSLGPRGTYGHVGGGGVDITIPAGPLLHGRTVTGIVMGDSVPQQFIPRLMALYEQGRFPFDQLITRYPFEQINEAIADMHAGTIVKPVLVMPEGAGN